MLRKGSKDALAALAVNGLLSRKVADSVSSKDKKYAKLLEPLLDKLPVRTVSASGGKRTKKVIARGEETELTLSWRFTDPNDPTTNSPMVQVPLELYKEEFGWKAPVVKPGKKRAFSLVVVKVRYEEDKIVILF